MSVLQSLSGTRELTRQLVGHLRSRKRPPAVFSEIALDGSWGSRGRIDVAAITVKPNYDGILVDGYEVKASRSDFQRDVDAMKWRKYLSVCDRVMFATEAGMLSKDEVPEDAGLIVLTSKGTWQTIVRAPRHSLDRDDANVLMRTIWRRAGVPERDDRSRRIREMMHMEDDEFTRKLDERAKKLIREANDAQMWLERDRQNLEAAREELEEERRSAEQAPAVLDALDEVLRLAKDAVGGGPYVSSRRVTAARDLLFEVSEGLTDRAKERARELAQAEREEGAA